jgi:DNA topoisomerase VI subunit B
MLGQWKDGMGEKQKVKAEVKECHSEVAKRLKNLVQGRLREESPPAIAVRRAGQRSFAIAQDDTPT